MFLSLPPSLSLCIILKNSCVSKMQQMLHFANAAVFQNYTERECRLNGATASASLPLQQISSDQWKLLSTIC